MQDNQKQFFGIVNAPSIKRYKNFINTAADSEEVWLLDAGEGYCTYDDGDEINIIVYPTEEFANYFSEGATPVKLDVHDFCMECKKLFDDGNVYFAVFPNGIDAKQVPPQVLFEDLIEALEELGDYYEEWSEWYCQSEDGDEDMS